MPEPPEAGPNTAGQASPTPPTPPPPPPPRPLILFRHLGSKARLLPRILEVMPADYGILYAEPFGGTGAVLLARRPARTEIFNDLDGNIVNFFRVLQDPDLSRRLYRRLRFTPFSRAELVRARRILAAAAAAALEEGPDGGADRAPDLDRAWAFFVERNQTVLGQQTGYEGTRSWLCPRASGKNEATRFANTVRRRLLAVAERLRAVQIENDDGLAVLRRYDHSDALFYVDPPYHPDTWVHKDNSYGQGRLVGSREYHLELIDLLLEARGAVVLSGYDHPDYEALSRYGWSKITADLAVNPSLTCGGRRRRRAREVIWSNPAAVAAKQRESSQLAFL